jgi:aminoglycoside phosphotransferase (APT) family kinase protein
VDSEPRTRPPAEVQIDVALARRLLAAQFPQWAGLAVRPVESAGWDNTIYRLGPDVAVRLPRRRVGAGQVEKEHRWLPVLGRNLPLAVPMPVGKGRPGAGYPWRWTMCSRLDGELAARAPVADMDQAAVSLARFIAALQAIDATGGPVSEFRGPLAGRDRVTRAAAGALCGRLDVGPALAVWEGALAAPAWTGARVWLHGDLHPANLLVANGELGAVIDFGLMGVGDPACDLMAAWTYLPTGARQVVRDALTVDKAAWSRGRRWALQLGLMAAAYAADIRCPAIWAGAP